MGRPSQFVSIAWGPPAVLAPALAVAPLPAVGTSACPLAPPRLTAEPPGSPSPELRTRPQPATMTAMIETDASPNRVEFRNEHLLPLSPRGKSACCVLPQRLSLPPVFGS